MTNDAIHALQFPELMKMSSLKPKILASDMAFAKSLVDFFNKRGVLSDKQMFHVREITRRAQDGSATRLNALKVPAIYNLFDGAMGCNKRLKVALPDSNGFLIVFKTASSTSSRPGEIFLTLDHSKEYLGRIDTNGIFYPSYGGNNHPTLTATLAEFNDDPVQTVAQYGRLTGICCFCRKHLDDAISIKVGYGPICAKKYKLPYK
jgi:hypothetical protein